MPVFAFIDTNVLLHYSFFSEVDWHAELGAAEVTLVFAPVVFAELDRHKWSGSRREKARAKNVIKALDDLSLSGTPERLRDGVFAVAVDAEPPDAIFVEHRLELQVSDDRLLASVLSFREQHSLDRVLILTADAGLRMKSRSRAIEIASPDERLELADEPDETARALAETQRELAAVRSATPKLRLTISGQSHIEWTYGPVNPLDNATIERLLDEWRGHNPRAASPTRSVQLAGKTYTFRDMAAMIGGHTEESAAEYNRKVAEMFKRYEKYLRDWPGVVDLYRRIVKLDFVIENTGTAPADDVDLHLGTEAEGGWLANVPNIPKSPRMPRGRNMLDLMSPLHNLPINLPVWRRDEPMQGPEILDHGRSAKYGVKRVKHHVPCELPIVYFRFAPKTAVQSFTISYQLIAANIQAPQTGSVHVKVTVTDAEDSPMPPPPMKSESSM